MVIGNISSLSDQASKLGEVLELNEEAISLFFGTLLKMGTRYFTLKDISAAMKEYGFSEAILITCLSILVSIGAIVQQNNELNRSKVLYSVNKDIVALFCHHCLLNAKVISRDLGKNKNILQVLAVQPDRSLGEELSKKYLKLSIPPLLGVIRRTLLESKSHVVILNPFFDEGGVTEIIDNLKELLNRGIRVSIVTRYLSGKNDKNRKLLKALLENSFVHKHLKLYEFVSDKGWKDLHAKAIIIDNGERAYVGSANLTNFSLGENFEIGVLIEGIEAKRLNDLFKFIISSGAAQPIVYNGG